MIFSGDLLKVGEARVSPEPRTIKILHRVGGGTSGKGAIEEGPFGTGLVATVGRKGCWSRGTLLQVWAPSVLGGGSGWNGKVECTRGVCPQVWAECVSLGPNGVINSMFREGILPNVGKLEGIR